MRHVEGREPRNEASRQREQEKTGMVDNCGGVESLLLGEQSVRVMRYETERPGVWGTE